MKISELLSGINKALASGDFTPDSDITVAISTKNAERLYDDSVEFIDDVKLDWIWTDIADTENFDKILVIKASK